MSKPKSAREFSSGRHYTDHNGRKVTDVIMQSYSSNREWLHSAPEIIPALASADEIRIFSRSSLSTAPLVVWTRHANPERLYLLQATRARTGDAHRPKPVHDGWMVILTKQGNYTISYDFYAGVLGTDPARPAVVDPTIREILCTAFEQTRQVVTV